MIKSGIYLILNKINGRFYIGSAVYIKNRLSIHKSILNSNYHSNILLQRAWNKYSSWNFEFYVIENVEDKTKLLEREQWWLNITQNNKLRYNICATAGNKLGTKMSEETKRKIGEANKGSTGMLGKKHTEETKNKQSLAQKGKTHRNKEKWPCPDGWKCNCNRCKPLRNNHLRQMQLKRKCC